LGIYTGRALVESAIGDIPAGLASFGIVHCNRSMSSFAADDENSAERRLKRRQSLYRQQMLNDTVISGNEHDTWTTDHARGIDWASDD
jgi:hypothetical protein